MISDHALFSSYEGRQGAANGQGSCFFSGMHRVLDGWMLARAPASPAQGLHHLHGPPYFNFPFFLYDVCVRVVVPFIDLWTHQPASHRRKVTQDFSAFLLRYLP